MIHITVDKDYEVRDQWEEITIDEACTLYKLLEEAPKLKGLYSCKDEEELSEKYGELTNKEHIKDFPKFYGKVICLLSDMSEETAEQILWHDRTAFYTKYLQSLVMGLVHLPIDYKPKNIKDFTFKGDTYLLPKSRILLGEKQPAAYLEAVQFTESADLEYYSKEMEGGKFQAATNIISILCLKDGEQYDEEVSLKRAEQFKELPMNVCWEVFFCFMNLVNISVRDMVTSSLGAMQKQPELLRELVQNGLGGMEALSALQNGSIN